MKRITPSAECSCGPVKTSPDGMLRLPSELIHVRPSTSSVRSVPSASMWISRAGARRSIRPAWNARSSPHAATGSSRSRNSARADEVLELARAHPGLLGGGGGRPQRDRPALGERAARAAARGRARRAPSGPGRRRPARSRSRWPGCAARRRCSRASASSRGRHAVQVRVARRRSRSPRPAPAADVAAAARPRARGSRAAGRAAAARPASSRRPAPAGPACTSRQ